MVKQGNFPTALLEEVKDAGQDFEWYPTTREIVSKVGKDIRTRHERSGVSLLDIGAGNGSVFALFGEIDPELISTKYAIEKSEVLINAMDKDIFVIGTDFNEQTLIDKDVEVIFCNPPYSEYELWARKIILEANCKTAYLVIPERWKDNAEIKAALERRGVKPELLGSFTFENSEFRKARAKVNILKLRFKYERYDDESDAADPFSVWFDDTFKFEADTHDASEYQQEETAAKQLHELVCADNLVESLAELYVAELNQLHENYRAVEKLDAEILRELSVNLKGLKAGLREKIKGAKNRYWHELFSRFDPITRRLTSKSREQLLRKLTEHTAIDFTAKNAYAVVIWAIKNANHYFDEQLLAVYMDMVSDENIRGYKSNRRFQTDEWRYLKGWDFRNAVRDGKVTHYSLDYRLVFDRWSSNFCTDKYGFGSYNFPNGLRKESHDFINDIFTVAKNLGFDVTETTMEVGQWHPGGVQKFRHRVAGKAGDKWVPFAEVRAYKNGNIHSKFCPDFMKALNIEAGRLNGWLRDPAHANEELEIDDAAKYFRTNMQLLPTDSKLLLTCEKQSA